MEHAERRPRPRIYDVVTGLWDSRPTTPSSATSSGNYFDPAKLHVLNSGQIPEGEGPSPSPGRSRLAGDGRPGPPTPVASSPPKPPKWCRRRRRADEADAPYADVSGAARIGRNPDQHKDPAAPSPSWAIADEEGKARPARQPGELRRRSAALSIAVARTRASSILTPRRPRSRDQPEQERPRTGDGAGQARELTVRQIAGRLGEHGGLAVMARR